MTEPSKRARELLAAEYAKAGHPESGKNVLRLGYECHPIALRAIEAALALTPPAARDGDRERALEEAVRAVILKWERGENHDEGAFDPDCEICLILRDVRATLPCETKDVEDLEAGCCAPCRARAHARPQADGGEG